MKLVTVLAVTLVSWLAMGCQLPWQPNPSSTGSLSLSFGPWQSRTVVPDLGKLLDTVARIDLTIERTDAAKAPVVQSLTGSGIASSISTIVNLAPGEYTVRALAYDSSPKAVAESAATAFTVATGSTVSLSLTLAPSLTSGTGAIDLTITYPVSAGITRAFVKMSHHTTGSIADNRAHTTTVVGNTEVLRLLLDDLPVGPYDLDLTLTDPSLGPGTLTYRQAVDVFAGVTSDKVVGPAGLLGQWALTEDYFGSSTYLANLTSSDQAFSFTSSTRDYTIPTSKSSVRYTATASYSGQALDYWSGTAWVPVISGSSFGPIAVPHVLTVRVTAPGGARGYYTVSSTETSGLNVDLTTLALPPLSFQTPASGADYFAMDQNVTVVADAAGATGSWRWLFDGALVPGQVAATFSAPATALVAASETGAHALTALFTRQGVTWARQKTIFLTTAGSDATLNLRSQTAYLGIGGSAQVYQGGQLLIAVADNDVSKLWWEVQGTQVKGSMTVSTDSSTDSLLFIPTSSLSPAWYYVFVRGLLADGSLAGVLVPFQVRAAGAVDGAFSVSLGPRFLPAVTSGDFVNGFSPYWNQPLADPLTLSLVLPTLPSDYDPAARAIQISFQGSDLYYDNLGSTQFQTTFAVGSHPPGIYAMNILYWGGTSLPDRHVVGSMTILIYASAGGNS